MVEGFATSMMFKVVPKEALLGLISIAGFVVTMLGYSQDTSLINLDVVDCYINISMLWIGFMECIAAGWIYGMDQVCEKIGWSAHLYLGGHRDPVQRCGPYMGLGVGGYDPSSNADPGWLAGLGFGFFAVGYAVTYKSALDHRRTRASTAVHSLRNTSL